MTSKELAMITAMRAAKTLDDAAVIYQQQRQEMREELLAKIRCVDCGDQHAEDYMVHTKVWRAAGMTPKGGRLCLNCLMIRLGRVLGHADFNDAPANKTIFAGMSIGRYEEGAILVRKGG